MTNFADRLHEAIDVTGSRLVVGLDPRFDRIPIEVRRAVLGIERGSGATPTAESTARVYSAFCGRVIELVAGRVPAVKVQVAFFEACGVPGMEAYAETLRNAREAGLLVIGDVKRGDIGSTADAYARAHAGPPDGDDRPPFAADAITVNPYFGEEGIAPFLRCSGTGGGVFILVRTSNPTAKTFQDLLVDGKPLFHRVAAEVDRWGSRPEYLGESGYSCVGAVAGGTYPAELAFIRRLLPRTPLLVPGFGAQGAGPADVAPAFDRLGRGAVISASRSILYAHEKRGGAWEDAVRAEVDETNTALNAIVATSRGHSAR